MSISDEILKLKQLLDCGGITQEEFDSMKAKIINGETSTQTPVSTIQSAPITTSSPSSVSSYHRRKYFNDKPFKVIGWISIGFAALFSLICIILLCEYEYEAAMAMVWELSFLPGSLAIVMGAFVKSRSYSSVLLVLGIVFTVVSLVVSIVTSALYAEDLASSLNYGYHYYY